VALRQVQQRHFDYERSGDPSRILGDDAVADAEVLAGGIRSEVLGELTPGVRQRFNQACRALGFTVSFDGYQTKGDNRDPADQGVQ
jgi:hypothetical protein